MLVAAAIVHVATLLPRVGALAEALPAGAWVLFTAYTLSTLTALSACALAVFLLWKASHKADGRALALFLAFLAVFWGSLFRFVEIGAAAETLSVNLSFGSGWLSHTTRASLLLAVAAFLRFSGLFPRRLSPERLPRARPGLRWLRRVRSMTLNGGFVWGAAVVTILLPQLVVEIVPRVLGFESDQEPSAAAGRLVGRLYLSAAGIAYLVVPILGIGVGVSNLRMSYRLASPDERSRMMWVMSGFSVAAWLMVAAVGGTVVMGALDLPEVIAIVAMVLIVLAPLLLVLGCALGVLYAGAIDPALALRRSTVYGALGALGVVAFAAIENGLSGLVERGLPLPGFVGPLAAGALVAAALIPVQRWVGRAVSRRMAAATTNPGAETEPEPSVSGPERPTVDSGGPSLGA